MYAGISPSEEGAGSPEQSLECVRVKGGAELVFEQRAGRTVAASVREWDGYRVRWPRRRDGLEAVIVNTGGGVAGGDHVVFRVEAREEASAILTTPTAERVYGALGSATASIDLRLELKNNARISWIPQETIIFDRARLKRTITADVDSSASLLISEAVIFGREAMGETVRTGAYRDAWRISRAGELVFAETARVEGPIEEILREAPTAGGRHVLATVLFVSPSAAVRLGAVRRALEDAGCEAAASAWNGLIVVRLLGTCGMSVRAAQARVLSVLMNGPLPRVWAN